MEYYVNLNRDNAKEIKQIKENDSVNTKNFKESYGKALERHIKGKKERLSKEIEEGKILDLENEKFEKRRAYISSKHKELNELRFS